MRFLADESRDFRVVAALHHAGHDLLAVAEVARGAPDEEVIELALAEHRVLLTEDRDFGQLVFAAGIAQGVGVLYIRCPEAARAALPGEITLAVRRLGSELERTFAVWTPRRLRRRRADRP